MQRRLLFVDDEEVIRTTLADILAKHGFQVTTAATVAEALTKITSEKFDVLLSDLNIGNPGDGLTVVSAMRRTQPAAVTMILTGYPAFETALEAIRQQVDDYILKPANVPALVSSIESRLAIPPRQRQLPPTQRVAMVLQQHVGRIEELWLSSAEKEAAPSSVPSSREQRIEYVRRVLAEVIRSAQSYSGEDSGNHKSSIAHTPSHNFAVHTPATIFAELRLLRRVVAQIVQENLLAVNLSYLIPDLAQVNDSLDQQAQDALALLSENTSATARST